MNYLKSYEHNGSVITLELRPNEGTPYVDPDTGVSESTHNIWASINGLSTLAAIAASATGDTVTHASLAGLWVSYVRINGGAPIYSASFEKVPAGSSIVFTTASAITVTAGDSVVAYYLPDGSGTLFPDNRKGGGLLKAEAVNIEDSMKKEIDGTSDAEINSWFTDLGYTRE